MRSLLLAAFAALLLAAPASAAPSWLGPVSLGTETLDPSSIGDVALGADGTAVAAWAQSNGGGGGGSWDLQIARRQPGSGFSAAITVPGTGGVGNVHVGVDGVGNATILYEQAGQVIALPWPVAAANPGPAQMFEAGGFSEIAVGQGGTAVATWVQNPNAMATAHVRAAVRTGPTGTFGPPATISADGDDTMTPTITGLQAAVGNGGHATVVWARNTLVPNITAVEANERAPGGNFAAMGTAISPSVAPDLSSEPVVAVDPAGRSTVLWTRSGFVRYAEHAPSDPLWSTEQRVSALPSTEDNPAVGAAPSGAVVAAWRSGNTIVSATRVPGGGAFAGFQPISGPSMNPSNPSVAVGQNGDALISWSLGDGSAIPTVLRQANGAFGPILNAISAASAAPGENLSFFATSIGIDDQGNGVAAWTRNSFRGGTNFNLFQSASFDAAAPTLTASVPPGGQVGASIGMAAAASDRVSPVSIAWAFGDGGTATGGAVQHAFGSAGAFNVVVAATDAAGNAASSTHPILIAALPPKAKPRVRSKLGITWGVAGKKIYLLRLKASKVPKGGKLELRCKGKRCPYKRVSSKKRKKGTITLFKAIKPSKVAGIKKRSFRAGQTLEVRITAPRRIGKVARYKLKAGRIPVAKDLCLPIGKKTPRKTCR